MDLLGANGKPLHYSKDPRELATALRDLMNAMHKQRIMIKTGSALDKAWRAALTVLDEPKDPS